MELAGEDAAPVDEDEEEREPVVLGTSTKQPTQQGKKRLTKRQKTETTEDDLLKKAIQCLDQSSGGTVKNDDRLELFGRYIATELRAILNTQAQRWAKLQIQSILFSAAQSQPSPAFSRPSLDIPYPQHYPPRPPPPPDRSSISSSVSPTSPFTDHSSFYSDMN